MERSTLSRLLEAFLMAAVIVWVGVALLELVVAAVVDCIDDW